jgi:hypothetical protein
LNQKNDHTFETDAQETTSFESIQRQEMNDLDHIAWWGIFVSLVDSLPRTAEASRLSDERVHEIHGQLLSIRECALQAISAAYAEHKPQIAKEYEEQARKRIFAFDKRVYIRVNRVFDKRRLKYLTICAGCMIFAVLLGLIQSSLAKNSNGLTVLIVISIGLAMASAVMAVRMEIRKKQILDRGGNTVRSAEPDQEQEDQPLTS